MLGGYLDPEEYRVARERGRRMAAEAVRCNPDARRRVEQTYGVERCMQLYPEAYPITDRFWTALRRKLRHS